MQERLRSGSQDLKDVLKANGGYPRTLQGVEEGVWTIDADGVTDSINPQGAEILGYAAEEVLGRSPLTFVVAEDAANASTVFHQFWQGSKTQREFRIYRKDRSERWIRVTAVSISDELGEYRGAVATFSDITERRMAEEEARQTAKELHNLYHNAPFGYHSLDATGVIMEINDAELGWLGYARDEVVGKMRFTDLMLPQHSDQFEQNFAQLKERESVRDLEYEMRRKDGTTFSVLVNAIAIKDSNGQFVRSHASVFDISDRKRAETELRESEARNAAVLHAALDCIVSIDSHGKIIEFNPAAERAFGYAREEVVGKDVAEIIIPAAMRDSHHRGMKRYLTTGEASLLDKRVQVTAMRSDGSEFPVELTVTRIDLRRQSIFSASLRDMTKEKWAEQELRRYADGMRAISRRLVEVQETERRWLANELHDLVGQKLTALNINLNIVKIESAPSIAAQIGARLEDSLKLVEETIESIRDVMAELRPAVLDDFGLTPALRWYADQFVKRMGVATTVIEQGPTRRLPQAAEEAFFRIAQEALANVAKYACAGEATVTLDNSPRTKSLTIADDGCGFDPSACQQPARDHGWGLMIMRERAAAVGAELRVESAPGHGTRVIVTLRDAAP
jgi:PAS domain S-box-containing protein